MKKNVKILLLCVLAISIVVSIVFPSYAAIGDGVVTTITSSVANGGNVKIGDEITYTIILKNNSDRDYVLPGISVIMPKGTEYVKVSTTEQAGDATVETEDDYTQVTVYGNQLLANDVQKFTVTVKVKEDAPENIKFADVTEYDDNGQGAVMILLFNSFDQTELNETLEIFGSEQFANAKTIAEVQNLLGDRAYINMVKQPITNIVAKEEKVEEKEEEKAEEKQEEKVEEKQEEKVEEKQEEKVEEKQEEKVEEKQEEPKQENTQKAEETGKIEESVKVEDNIAKPIVNDEKPTTLPKTGNEINSFNIILGISAVIVGIVLIVKKENK